MFRILALIPSGALLAQTGGSEPWVDSLLKGGPFAVVLLLIVTDKIGTNSERDRLREENTQLYAELRTLNESIRTEVVPPLVQVAPALQRVIEVLSDEDRFPPKRTTRRPRANT